MHCCCIIRVHLVSFEFQVANVIGVLMARITIEDCSVVVKNRFHLILLASVRAKEIALGAQSVMKKTGDKFTIVALREIAQNLVSLEALENVIVQKYRKFPVNANVVSTKQGGDADCNNNGSIGCGVGGSNNNNINIGDNMEHDSSERLDLESEIFGDSSSDQYVDIDSSAVATSDGSTGDDTTLVDTASDKDADTDDLEDEDEDYDDIDDDEDDEDDFEDDEDDEDDAEDDDEEDEDGDESERAQ